jgi:hypothetical protein
VRACALASVSILSLVVMSVGASAQPASAQLSGGAVKAAYAFLEVSDAKAITIPYRASRAVIFDSNLFHKTDVIRFAEGYENRRINITMCCPRGACRGGTGA